MPDTSRVDPRWLYWHVVGSGFQRLVLENASATTLPIINKSRVESLPIRIPNLSLQRKVVEVLEQRLPAAERAEHEATRALVLLDRIEQAILAKTFRGDLVPQNPNDQPAKVTLSHLQQPATASCKRRIAVSTSA